MLGVREQLRVLVDGLSEEQARVALDVLREVADVTDLQSEQSLTRNMKDLMVSGDEFFGGRRCSIEEIAVRQGVQPIYDPAALHGDFWPEEEGVDDFVETVREWRREGGNG